MDEITVTATLRDEISQGLKKIREENEKTEKALAGKLKGGNPLYERQLQILRESYEIEKKRLGLVEQRLEKEQAETKARLSDLAGTGALEGEIAAAKTLAASDLARKQQLKEIADLEKEIAQARKELSRVSKADETSQEIINARKAVRDAEESIAKTKAKDKSGYKVNDDEVNNSEKVTAAIRRQNEALAEQEKIRQRIQQARADEMARLGEEKKTALLEETRKQVKEELEGYKALIEQYAGNSQALKDLQAKIEATNNKPLSAFAPKPSEIEQVKAVVDLAERQKKVKDQLEQQAKSIANTSFDWATRYKRLRTPKEADDDTRISIDNQRNEIAKLERRLKQAIPSEKKITITPVMDKTKFNKLVNDLAKAYAKLDDLTGNTVKSKIGSPVSREVGLLKAQYKAIVDAQKQYSEATSDLGKARTNAGNILAAQNKQKILDGLHEQYLQANVDALASLGTATSEDAKKHLQDLQKSIAEIEQKTPLDFVSPDEVEKLSKVKNLLEQEAKASEKLAKATEAVDTAKQKATESLQSKAKTEEIRQYTAELAEAKAKLKTLMDAPKSGDAAQAAKKRVDELTAALNKAKKKSLKEYAVSPEEVANTREVKKLLAEENRLKQSLSTIEGKLTQNLNANLNLERRRTRELKQQETIQERLKNKQSRGGRRRSTVAGITSAIDRILPDAFAPIGYGIKLMKAFARAALEATTFVAGIGAALAAAFYPGYKYAKEMEATKLGMAGTFANMTEINGIATTFEQGLAAAEKVQKRLRLEAALTGATYEELASAYQAYLGVGLRKGFNAEKLIDYTSLIVNTVKAQHLPANQIIQEGRVLLQGGIRPQSSTLGSILHISDADIAKHTAKGDYPDWLMKQMDGYRLAQKARAQSMEGREDYLKETLGQVSAASFKPFEDYYKNAITEIANSIGSLDKEMGGITPNPAITSFLQDVKDLIDSIIIQFGSFDENGSFIFNEETAEQVEAVKEWFSDLWDIAKDFVSIFISVLPAFSDIATLIGLLTKGFKFIVHLAKEWLADTGVLRVIVEWIMMYFTALFGKAGKLVNPFKKAYDWCKGLIGGLRKNFAWVDKIAKKLAEIIQKLNIIEKMKQAKEAVSEAARAGADKLLSSMGKFGQFIKDVAPFLAMPKTTAGATAATTYFAATDKKTRKTGSPMPEKKEPPKPDDFDLKDLAAKKAKEDEENAKKLLKAKLDGALKILKAALQQQLTLIKQHLEKISLFYKQGRISKAQLIMEEAAGEAKQAEAKLIEMQKEYELFKETGKQIVGSEESEEAKKAAEIKYQSELKARQIQIDTQKQVVEVAKQGFAEAAKMLREGGYKANISSLNLASGYGASAVAAARSRVGDAYVPDKFVCSSLVVESWDKAANFQNVLKDAGYDPKNMYMWVPDLIEAAKKFGAWVDAATGYVPKAGNIAVGDGVGNGELDGHVVLVTENGGGIGAQNPAKGVIEKDDYRNLFAGQIAGYILMEKLLANANPALATLAQNAENASDALGDVRQPSQGSRDFDKRYSTKYGEKVADLQNESEKALLEAEANLEKEFGLGIEAQIAKSQRELRDTTDKIQRDYTVKTAKRLTEIATLLSQNAIDNLVVNEATRGIERISRDMQTKADLLGRELALHLGGTADEYFSAMNTFSDSVNSQIKVLEAKAKEFAAKGNIDAAHEVVEKIKEFRNKINDTFKSWEKQIEDEFSHARNILSERIDLSNIQRENAESYLKRTEAREKLVGVLKQEETYRALVAKYKEAYESATLDADKKMAKDAQNHAEAMLITITRQKQLLQLQAKEITLLDEVGYAAKQAIEDGLLEFLTEGILKAESLGQALREFLINVLTTIQKAFAKRVVDQFMNRFFTAQIDPNTTDYRKIAKKLQKNPSSEAKLTEKYGAELVAKGKEYLSTLKPGEKVKVHAPEIDTSTKAGLDDATISANAAEAIQRLGTSATTAAESLDRIAGATPTTPAENPAEATTNGEAATVAEGGQQVETALTTVASSIQSAGTSAGSTISTAVTPIQTALTQFAIDFGSAAQQLISAVTNAANQLSLSGLSGSGGGATGKAMGGYISGPGTATSDSISARLSNGEFVVRAAAVRQYGRGMLERINNGSFSNIRVSVPKFARGGYVGMTGARATEEFGTSFAANVSPRINVSNYVDGQRVFDQYGKQIIRNEVKKENIRHAKLYSETYRTLG